MSTEPTTEETLPVEQNKTQIAEIANPVLATIFNAEEHKKTLTALADKHKDAKFNDLNDKDGIKGVQSGYSETRQGRLAVDKLEKNFKGIVKQISEYGEDQLKELREIIAPVEKKLKAEKDRVDELKEDARVEQLRIEEEKKQLRMFELTQLGMVTKEGHYQLGDMSITLMELIQSTEAQWEGKVAQVKVIYEAEQLRLAEEAEIERERLVQEQRDRMLAQEAERKEKEALRLANEAKQAELDAASRERDVMRIEIAESRVDLLKSKGFDGDLKLGHLFYGTAYKVKAATIVDSNRAEWAEVLKGVDAFLEEIKKPKEVVEPVMPLVMMTDGQLNEAISNGTAAAQIKKNGTTIKFTEAERESIIEDMLAGEEALVKEMEQEYFEEHPPIVEFGVRFSKDNPYIEARVGKGDKAPIFRIYVEAFLEEATAGIEREQVSATGDFEGTDFLFMVIKGK